MAKTKISEYDSTAANNTDIDSINIAEGCAPSGINNAIRELMAHLKDMNIGSTITMLNTTEEDGEGGRANKIIFKGEQSGGEESVLGEIQASHDGTADDEKGDLIFRTNDGSDGTSPTERMRIDSNGNVGIGVSPTTSYGNALQIHDTGTSGANLRLTDSTSGSGTGNGFEIVQIGVNNYTLNRENGFIATYTNNTERMRIDSTGNLNIGSDTNVGYGPLQIGSTSSTPTVLQMLSSTSANNSIHFGDGTSGDDRYRGYVQYGHADNALQFGTDATERMRIDSSGVASIGSTSKTFASIDATRLAVVGGSNGSSNAVQMIVDEDSTVEGGSTLLAIGFSADNSFSTANYINFFDSGGQQGRIEGAGAGSVAYQTSSDRRLKSNIRDTGSKWDALKQIQVRDYEWTADTSNTTVTGFIAQELHTIFPDAVSEGDEDVTKKPWAVDYGRTTPIIIKALQEAIAKIEALETRVAALEG